MQEYKDDETYKMVTDLKQIAKHYVKGSCFFDFLACVPFAYLIKMNQDSGSDALPKLRLWKLFKLLSVPRLMGLLDVERVKKIVNNYYAKKLLHAVNTYDQSYKMPILKMVYLI